MRLSVVVPVCNEAESISILAEELAIAIGDDPSSVEWLFVDDGSIDGSWPAIIDVCKQRSCARAIRLRRNFGKSAALAAGFSEAQGNIVVTIDGDLQDDPAEIPRLIQSLNAGLDLIVGWKKSRQDPWHKTLPSRVFNLLVSTIAGVRLHDHNTGLKAMKREVVDGVVLYGDRHRFLPVLASERGFAVGELPVHHRPRRFGSSKYGVGRFLRGFIDLGVVWFLARRGRRPGHFFGALAMFLLLASVVGFANNRPWAWPATIIFTQLAIAALLAELVVHERVHVNPPYAVADRINPSRESV
jgi:glycosyltransferase involved in cell wall biosynthesis